jgi:hypothetical protein
MIISEKVNLNIDKNIDIINILLNHTENLHEQGFFKEFEKIILIKKTQSNNIIETIRKAIIKTVLPKFIMDLIPIDIQNNFNQFKEFSIWDIENKIWSFEYKPISNIQLYTLEGFCIINNSTILIKLDFNIIQKISFQELIEKTIIQVIMNNLKKIFKELENKKLHKLIPVKTITYSI